MKAIITDEHLSHYGKEVFLLWRIPGTKLWAYSLDRDDVICFCYAGPSQFKHIKN